MKPSHHHTRSPLLATALMLAVSASGSAAQSTDEEIGARKTVQVPLVRIEVRGGQQRGFNETYAAPAGWQIESFQPVVISQRHAAYTFITVPSNYSGLSEREVQEQFNSLRGAAAQKNVAQRYEGKISEAESMYERAFQKTYYTHAAITTRGRVRSYYQPLLRRPGHLWLDLRVTLVRLPSSQEEFERSLALFRTMVQEDSTMR